MGGAENVFYVGVWDTQDGIFEMHSHVKLVNCLCLDVSLGRVVVVMEDWWSLQ